MEEKNRINEMMLSQTAKNKDKNTVVYISLKDKGIDMLEQKYIMEEIVNNYAKKNKLNISEYYIDLIPSRLELTNRSSLAKLLKKVERKEINQILIPDINHISRNIILVQKILDNVFKSNVKVVCCSSGIILK